MIENIIGWGLIGLLSITPLYLIYIVYKRYKRWQEKQTQLLYYKQKLKEEYLIHQKTVWLDDDSKQ